MEITQLQIKDALMEFFRGNAIPVDDKDYHDNVLREDTMITLASFLARRIQKSEEETLSPLQYAMLDLRSSLENLDGSRSISLVKTFVLLTELMSPLSPQVKLPMFKED